MLSDGINREGYLHSSFLFQFKWYGTFTNILQAMDVFNFRLFTSIPFMRCMCRLCMNALKCKHTGKLLALNSFIRSGTADE